MLRINIYKHETMLALQLVFVKKRTEVNLRWNEDCENYLI